MVVVILAIVVVVGRHSQARRERGGVKEGSYSGPRDVCGAPTSPQNIKYRPTIMRHLKIQKFSREHVSLVPAVAFDVHG